MLSRHWLVGIFCASMGISIGCQGNFESAGVNDGNASSDQAASPSLRAFRWGLWNHLPTGTGGQSGGSSGTGSAATGGATGGASATGGQPATGGHTGGTTGTGGVATGGVTGGPTGGISGTGGSAPPSGTGGTAPPSSPPPSGGSTAGSGTCGNGSLDSGESCDGSAIQSATCAQLGFTGGTLACSSSCQFDVSACTGGTVTPSISATVTSCAAPCGVFFDVTGTSGLSGSDYVGANWNWDFNDPRSPHPGDIGFAVGHVYDNPGTYVATVRVRDLAGASGKASVTITVTAPSYTTYYVSSSGSDSNNGLSMSAPFATVAHAFALQGANTTLLFRRGDTFTLGGTATETGPALVGAYTDPSHASTAAPIWSAGSSGSVTLKGTAARIQDIHLVSGGNGNGIQLLATTNPVVERLEIEGVGSGCCGSTNGLAFYGDTGAAVNTFIFDNNVHDFLGYGYYGATDHLAIVGNQFLRFSGGDHGIRVIHGNLTYVAYNTVVGNDTDTPLSGITMRGNHTNIVLSHNTSNRLMEFTPQNTDAVEQLQHCLAEGNIVADNRTTGFYEYSFGVTANHVVVRNNVFSGSPNGVSVFGMPQIPANWVDRVSIYNNTMYFFGTTYNATWGSVFASQAATTGSVAVRNNLFAQGQSLTDSQVAFLDAYQAPQGTHSEDHNLGYDPNGVGTWTPGSGTGDLVGNPAFVATSSASAYKLGSTSAARNAGAALPVYQDRAFVIRPKGSAWDVGAYQY